MIFIPTNARIKPKMQLGTPGPPRLPQPPGNDKGREDFNLADIGLELEFF